MILGPRLLTLLRQHPDFRRLFLSAVVSFMGDWFAFVAASGMVADATGKGGLAAVVYAANVLPVFFLSPLAGALADRVNRKAMFVVADLARVLPALGMVAAARLGSAPLMVLCIAVLAALAAFSEPLHAAVVPNLVPKEDLSLAQAALSSVWGSMLFLGAALGGALAVALGREAAFLLNAATFALSAVLILRIRKPLQEGGPPRRPGFFADLREVWTAARRSLALRALLVTKTGVGLGNGVVGLLPAFAVALFGTGDGGVGILLGARGLGALIGPSLGRLFVREDEDGRRLMLVCGVSMLSYGAAYAFLPLTASLWIAALCVGLAHLGGGAQWAMSTYGLQRATPDAMRGRVLAIDYGLATLSIGVSSLVAGGAAELWGLHRASWGMAAVAVLYGGGWLWWTRPLWRPRPRPSPGPRAPLASPP